LIGRKYEKIKNKIKDVKGNKKGKIKKKVKLVKGLKVKR
jgi:hypothetical protein